MVLEVRPQHQFRDHAGLVADAVQQRVQDLSIAGPQLALVRRAQPVLHAHQRFQGLRQMPGQPVPRLTEARITQGPRHTLGPLQGLTRPGRHERRLRFAGPFQQTDHAARFLGRQRLAPRQGQERFLVARGQPCQLPR